MESEPNIPSVSLSKSEWIVQGKGLPDGLYICNYEEEARNKYQSLGYNYPRALYKDGQVIEQYCASGDEGVLERMIKAGLNFAQGR